MVIDNSTVNPINGGSNESTGLGSASTGGSNQTGNTIPIPKTIATNEYLGRGTALPKAVSTNR